MPRLPPRLLYRAHRISPHLRILLPACRDIESARHELRWIREHVSSFPSTRHAKVPVTSSAAATSKREEQEAKVAHLCARRGRGEPLQYVLGTQPFGPLEIRCAPGVLVPRLETEAYTVYLADLLTRHYSSSSPHPPQRHQETSGGELVTKGDDEGRLGVLDLCTGTGCIALLLYERLRRHAQRRLLPPPRVAGVDISPTAVALARRNLDDNTRAGLLPRENANAAVVFTEADIFADDFLARSQDGLLMPSGQVDVLVSNPPYISTRGFDRDTGRSVRNFEPRLALVPDERLKATAVLLECALEDVFYARLLDIAKELKPRFVLFEVGDLEQAKRVVKMATTLGNSEDFAFEIWRDEPDAEGTEVFEMGSGSTIATIRGEGHGRSVFIYRKTKS
ncbi:hypothetical protein PFICI_08204 [Pestalotiopsis fici W106-1]|uniref:Release factor glutamine methyltransferase N-terminal domain-containing protein n=1 Tax=Pestalotiopsis fici (strain W106-1 / CGMCC3.15140) TaxID=1229662 RepID=W3X3L9_PESFW|nr:uncharacterized protein PFICI_08204 [Pestalotiopsis fici W106-1]ETS80675.1 hypothetical protein PFICI_08204 [Pestalotiopsis fici W106-1]